MAASSKGSSGDIYGNKSDVSDSYAGKVSSEALDIISSETRKGDVNGEKDGRAKTDMEFPNVG